MATVSDRLLEASVVGSFSRLGPFVRRRVEHWTMPEARPGRTVLLTGASSGLGRAAAAELGGLAMTVVCVGRDVTRTTDAARAVEQAGGVGIAMPCDLADLAEVEQLAADVCGELDHLDVLVHNAGALSRVHSTTPQGLETTLAVHLVAPHLLTAGVAPLLQASTRPRVLTMTSGGLYTEPFDLARLIDPSPEGYRGTVAYARAKRAQVVWTSAMQARRRDDGPDFSLVHPGWAATPGVAASLPRFEALMGPLLRTPAEGVDTLVWLASLEPGDPPGGQLWLDRRPRPVHRLPTTKVDDETAQRQGAALLDWLDDVTNLRA
jgi:NAD(P)-dependent dehydrogenase (short-subunit alcohol dehydrogenase family)